MSSYSAEFSSSEDGSDETDTGFLGFALGVKTKAKSEREDSDGSDLSSGFSSSESEEEKPPPKPRKRQAEVLPPARKSQTKPQSKPEPKVEVKSEPKSQPPFKRITLIEPGETIDRKEYRDEITSVLINEGKYSSEKADTISQKIIDRIYYGSKYTPDEEAEIEAALKIYNAPPK